MQMYMGIQMYVGQQPLTANCSQVISNGVARKRFDELVSQGFVTSFTVVYSSSIVKIPVGVDSNMDVSGDGTFNNGLKTVSIYHVELIKMTQKNRGLIFRYSVL